MPSLLAIETRLHEHANGRPSNSELPEEIVYELMHTGHRTGRPIRTIAEQVHAYADDWLPDNTLPETCWQCVCFGWVLRDLLWHEADRRLATYQRSLHEQIIQQGRAALLTDRTGLLDGSALYLNYLIEQAQFSTDNHLPGLTEEAVQASVEYQLTSLVTSHNGAATDLSLHPGLIGLLLALLRFAETNALTVTVHKQLNRFVQAVAQLAQPVDYLLDRYSFFPARVQLDTQEYEMNNSMSWATGDLGVVLLLYRAARYFKDPVLYKLADSIGTFTLIRDDLHTTQVNSPWFLHGAAGIAAMYEALGNVSGNDRYQKGQQYWTERTVQLLMTTTEPQPESVGSLLHGYAGVLLCLHTFEHACRSDWKRLFLL